MYLITCVLTTGFTVTLSANYIVHIVLKSYVVLIILGKINMEDTHFK